MPTTATKSNTLYRLHAAEDRRLQTAAPTQTDHLLLLCKQVPLQNYKIRHFHVFKTTSEATDMLSPKLN